MSDALDQRLLPGERVLYRYDLQALNEGRFTPKPGEYIAVTTHRVLYDMVNDTQKKTFRGEIDAVGVQNVSVQEKTSSTSSGCRSVNYTYYQLTITGNKDFSIWTPMPDRAVGQRIQQAVDDAKREHPGRA